MNVKDLSTYLVGIVVAILVVMTVLVPIVDSSLDNAGNPVTFYNDDFYTFKEVQDGDELVIERYLIGEEKAVKMSLNGEDVPINRVYTPIVISDGILANIYPANNVSTISYRMVKDNPTNESQFWGAMSEGTITISFDDGTFTFTMLPSNSDPLTFTVSCDWGYIACPLSDSSHIASAASDNAYVREGTIPILCASITTSVTMIYQNNTGEFGISNPDVTGAPIYTYSKVDGTTDIYTLNVKVGLTLDGVTTESDVGVFLVPYKVDGHTDSGVIYTLVSIIPIFAVIGILVGVVSMMYLRRT